MELPVPGSDERFPDCPLYYLRARIPAPGSLGPAIKRSTADHLIDGVTHPILEAGPVANELENGAVRADDLSLKVLELARLCQTERASKREYQDREREKARGSR